MTRFDPLAVLAAHAVEPTDVAATLRLLSLITDLQHVQKLQR